MKNSPRIIGAIVLAAALCACARTTPGSQDAEQVAAKAIRAISTDDWSALAALADRRHGVRFSPYACVDTSTSVVLSPAEIAAFASDSRPRRWGTYDGSGDSIELTIGQYFDRFVSDRMYANAERGAPNERIGSSNTIDNIRDAYAGRDVVFFEYYAPGTDKHAGMDWRSLRLVLERTGGQWHLIGVVHDEWTI
jgi:hypothetical protein